MSCYFQVAKPGILNRVVPGGPVRVGMRAWGALIAIVLAAAAQGLSQAPSLTLLTTPYPALQSSTPIQVAGGIWGPGWVPYGPQGTPLTLTGSGFGATQGTSTVQFVPYKNGAVDTDSGVTPATATVQSWSATSITVSIPWTAKTGLVEIVLADGAVSNGLPFIVVGGTYASSCPASVSADTLRITTTSLPNGTEGRGYSVQLQATGGSGNYTWTLMDGDLPDGLSMSATGAISGTPKVAEGPDDITVEVVDNGSVNMVADATLSLQIVANPATDPSTSLYSFAIQTSSGASGYDAAGNVTAYDDSVNGAWSFTYDSLHRLATGAATGTNNPAPNYCWQYDNFGNRLVQASSASAYTSSHGGANTCNVPVPTYTNNQLVGGSLQYDAAGDVKSDTNSGNSYLYDGEGRLCAVEQTIAGVTTKTQYIYDAEGNRVAKGSISTFSCDTTSNGFTPTTVYVLGPGGEQLSEISNTSATQTPNWQVAHTNVYASGQLMATYEADPTGTTEGSLYFHLSDWLGTRRQQTDYAGNPKLNFTSLPYGDGLTPVPVSGSAPDATEHHFTGKERDAESGNDYFGARYYASSMGRWMSPDWSKTPSGVPYAILSNPQTLNLYSYVLNNPLTHFDPDGHACDSLWHCAQGFLNAVEVKVSASLGTQGSVQWGVAKAEYHATVVGVEGKSGLGGGNKDATVSTGVGASASASGGPVKASVSVNAGAQASTADGASASVSASAKVAMGPASGSASATMGTDGPSTSVRPGASADKDTDWKVGGSFTAGVGVGGDINFSQLGRAFSDAGDSLNALGSYLVDKYMPSGAPSSSGGAPGIPDPQHPF